MIVRSWEPLSLDYVPASLPFREKEIERIRRFLKAKTKPRMPSTMILDGFTGTGKTATIRWMVEKAGVGSDLKPAYVNARDITTYDALVSIASSLGLLPPRSKGLSPSEIGSMIEQYSLSYDVLAILDEVDRIRVRSFALDNLLAFLMRTKGILTILVTNKLEWADENISIDLRPFLKTRVRFDPYNADQLREILRRRAEEAFVPGDWEEGAIARIAALVAQETGSAKEAIRLLRIAAEIAEEEGSDCLREEHVRRAEEEDEVRSVMEVMARIPIQGRLILSILAEKGAAYSSELYMEYFNRVQGLGMRVLSKPSFFKILDLLERNFLIEMRPTRLRGKPYRVSLAVDRGMLMRALEGGLP